MAIEKVERVYYIKPTYLHNLKTWKGRQTIWDKILVVT
jgi:hypothetical protein